MYIFYELLEKYDWIIIFFRIILFEIYLNSDSVNPIALHAQLKRIYTNEPVWTRIYPGHHTNKSVIAVEKGTTNSCALALWHAWCSKCVQNVWIVSTSIQTICTTCLYILSCTRC